MELQKIYTDSDFSNAVIPEGTILTYLAQDDEGNIVTKTKNSSGEIGVIGGGGSGESVIPGYFINNANGTLSFQPIGGTAETVSQVSIVNTGVAEPDYSAAVVGTDTSDATALAADIAEGKTAYIATGKVTGTATGGEDSLKTILYMPMNGSLSIYGDLKYTRAKGKAYSEMDGGEVDWTPEYAEGVFSGEQALSFAKGPVDDEGYPLEPPYCKYVDLPVIGRFVNLDFTWDFWLYCDSRHNTPGLYSNIIGLNANVSIYGFRTSNGFETMECNLAGGGRIDFSPIRDAWNHVAVTRVGDSAGFYINGERKHETNDLTVWSWPMQIGMSNAESSFKISHLRILNHALWTENFTPPTKDSYAAYMV